MKVSKGRKDFWVNFVDCIQNRHVNRLVGFYFILLNFNLNAILFSCLIIKSHDHWMALMMWRWGYIPLTLSLTSEREKECKKQGMERAKTKEWKVKEQVKKGESYILVKQHDSWKCHADRAQTESQQFALPKYLFWLMPLQDTHTHTHTNAYTVYNAGVLPTRTFAVRIRKQRPSNL